MLSLLRHKFAPILIFFSVIGPGLITSLVDNDAGGITTYSVAGAEFGYHMIWVLIPIFFVLIIVQEMCARLGVVSGKGLSDLIRESYGVRITFYLLLALLIANLATLISEFSGVAASLEIFGIPRYVSVPISVALIWVVIIKGNYRSVEKIFFIGALLYISYIISGFLAKPDWTQVARSIVKPQIEFSKHYLLLVIGMIGTTITPWMQFYLQSSIVEKGTKVENYRYVKWDVITGSLTTHVVAFLIIVASAATLHTHGIRIETASDAAVALRPFAGAFAQDLFALGLLNASLLGAIIVSLSTAYSICEGLGFEAGVNKTFREAPWFNGIFSGLIILGAVPALFPGTPLIQLMLTSQVINGILLAPVLIFIALLVNKKWLMGEYVNNRWYNMVVGLTVGVLIILSAILVWTGFN